MKEAKSIFGLLLLIVGSFVMYRIVPVYWSDYKLERVLAERAVTYTYAAKSDSEIAKSIAEQARGLNIALTPEQVKVDRTASELTITATYTASLDLLLFDYKMDFTTSSHNTNVMR